MAKYKFLFSNCATQNYCSKSKKEAIEAAKESLRVMHALNAGVRYVVLAEVIGRGRYSIIASYGL